MKGRLLRIILTIESTKKNRNYFFSNSIALISFNSLIWSVSIYGVLAMFQELH